VRVTATGNIGFPLISEKIQAAGLTPLRLEEKLEQLLLENGLVSHPQVSVFVREQNSQPVTVMGAVARPMIYQLIRPMTLLELLAAAGGISDNAGAVILITRQKLLDVAEIDPISTRDEPGPNTQTIKVRLQDLLETANNVFNIPIYGGDVVNVPPSGIVYVMGPGVASPGGYVLQSHGEQITVLKAVALAHGLAGFAKKDDAVIFRVDPATGQRDAIPVHISQIEKSKTEDVAMKSNDILYVPQSGGKKAAAMAAQAALQVGTAVAIYRVAGNKF
jgi:polysaccharide biosynthesis/export protein